MINFNKRIRKKIFTCKVKVCIDDTSFESKPSNSQFAVIVKDIASKEKEITIEELAQYLVQPNGNTFCPATFYGIKADNDSWKGQQIFAIDIDEDLPFDEALSRCKKYRLVPSFAYTTFSDTNHDKYRLVFILPKPIHNKRVYEVLIESFHTIFPEMDSKCKPPSHIFLGGKEVIYENYQHTVDIHEIIDAAVHHITVQNKSNSSKNIESFCSNVGIQIKNGIPNIEKFQFNSFKPLQISYPKIREYNLTTKKTQVLYYYTRTWDKFVVLFTLYLSNQKGNNVSKKTGKKKYRIDNTERDSKNLNRNITPKKVIKGCRLFREFYSGEVWLYHQELFGVATNLLTIEGGRKAFLQGLGSREEYSEEKYGDKLLHFKNFYMGYINKRNYNPSNCIDFCRYIDSCPVVNNIIDTVHLPRGKAVKIKEENLLDISESEEILKEYMTDILKSRKPGVNVIKAETGSGKSQRYIDSDSLSEDIIPFPTHDLKDEKAIELREKGHNVIVTPKRPELDRSTEKKIQYFYAMGAHKEVNRILHTIANEGNTEVKEYLDEMEKVHNATEGIILTTHERALTDDKLGGRTVLFDEDPMDKILKLNEVTIADLRKLKNALFQLKEDEVKEADELHHEVSLFIDKVYSLREFQFLDIAKDSYSLLDKIRGKIIQLIQHERIFSERRNEVTNIFGIFDADYLIKTRKDSVIYIKKRKVDYEKVTVLSATANRMVYEKLFGESLNFLEVPRAKPKGKVIQYLRNSYSRHRMPENNGRLLGQAQKIVGDYPVITFKDFKDDFPNTVGTFGSVEGTNTLEGMDIFVVGTPHLPPYVYLLYAKVLGIPIPENIDFKYQEVEYGNYRFNFFTFQDSKELQALQLSMIESDLVQAIGRARVLRNDCTVWVLSNLPIRGAEMGDNDALLASIQEKDNTPEDMSA